MQGDRNCSDCHNFYTRSSGHLSLVSGSLIWFLISGYLLSNPPAYQVVSTPDLDSVLTARNYFFARPTLAIKKYFFADLRLTLTKKIFFSWRSISESGDFFWWYFRLRTKMWISRAVMVGFLWFWVIWRATSVLLHLSTTFMGLGATLLPLSPKTLGRFIWN